MLVQVDLQAGNRFLTCWVEPKVKVGNVITLKNHEQPRLQWRVLRVGELQEAARINRGWHNNI
jgi:hypothetical protein